jgi:peptidoglycan/LPS O-acetylase OafA/YrhL
VSTSTTATAAGTPRRQAHSGLPYVAALDGVRAIAVGAVLLYHGGVSIAPGGFLGVDMFFVLSGFLITSLLITERAATGRIDLFQFWLRRARRLLPAAFLLIAVTALVAAIFLPADAVRTRGDAIASFFYVNNWHQVLSQQSYFETFQRPSLLQHLWSLAVEEQFYLLWPLALGLCMSKLGRVRTAQLTLVLAIVSAIAMGILFDPGQDPSRVYFGTDTHASGLLIGALLAFVWPLGPLRGRPNKHAAIVLDAGALAGLVLVVAAITGWQDYEPWVYRGGILVFSIACALLIAAVVHPAGRIRRVLGLTPFVWIGRRSYGIYLWHWPIMALTRPGLDLDWSRWVLVPLQIGAAVGIAALSYTYVEMPIRSGEGRKRIAAWLGRRPPRRRLAIAGATVLAVALPVAWIGSLDAPAQDRALTKVRSTAAAAAPAGKASAEESGGDQDTTARSGAQEQRAKIDKTETPLAVGASVMLGAQTALGRHATVDAAVGRQTSDIIGRLEAYKASGQLPDRVIVQVGENGPVWGADVKRLRAVLADVPEVLIVNVRVPRSWQDQVNGILDETVANWPQAHVVDWHDASVARPALLYDDQTHPNPDGQEVYAKLVERALRQFD